MLLAVGRRQWAWHAVGNHALQDDEEYRQEGLNGHIFNLSTLTGEQIVTPGDKWSALTDNVG